MEDKRIMLIDTETVNSIDDPIVYDVSFEVFDLEGNTYDAQALVNKDVYNDTELMSTCYYAENLPEYEKRIEQGEAKLLSWFEIKQAVRKSYLSNNCKIVTAHNARFDSKAINFTQRYITTSRWRYFMPFKCEWWDTLKMVRELFKDDENYRKFCLQNSYLTMYGLNRYTAEIVYRYLTQEKEFSEKHIGIDDVKIEKEIFLYCLRTKPDIDGKLWKNEEKDLSKLPNCNWYKSVL